MKVHIGWVIVLFVFNIYMLSDSYLERTKMWGKWNRHWQVEWLEEKTEIERKINKAIEDLQISGNKAIVEFQINASRHITTAQ